MWRPELGDYIAAAAEVLNASEEQLQRLPRLDLAESALAAPFAGFGDEEVYPALELKAAVLLERLVRNHPLPDGNKRAAFALLGMFLSRNGLEWGEADADLDAGIVERVAAGEAEPSEVEQWIRQRTAA